MKQQILKTVVLVMVGAFMAASSVSAVPTTLLKARIPFDFIVGSETFRAGDHTVERPTPGVLLIRNSSNRTAMVFSIRVQAPWHNYPKLVFKRYGNQHFLSQVWDGVSDGRELPMSPRQREAARTAERLARKAVDAELVYINAR